MNTDISLALTLATALQGLIECAQKVEPHLPAHERRQYTEALDRARRARVEIQQWVEERR